MSEFNWKNLRKELFNSPPRPRSSLTYQHTDVFSPQKTSEPKTRLNPTNSQSKIFDVSTNINPNQQRMRVNQQPIIIKKQSNHLDLTPNNTRLNLSNLLSQNVMPPTQNSQRMNSCTSREKLLQSNQSNIFNLEVSDQHKERSSVPLRPRFLDSDSSKTQWNNPFMGKTKTDVNENAKFDRNYSKIKRWQEQQSPAFQENILEFKQSSVQRPDFKQKNQNFSDLFGYECGAKGAIQPYRFRNLPTQLGWINCDSQNNLKDIGQDYRPKSNARRSKQIENSSIFDQYTDNSKTQGRLSQQDKISNRNDSYQKYKVMLRQDNLSNLRRPQFKN